jgi:hypothetical protein
MTSREIELKSEGWTKRSTHDEPRLSEIVAMYRELQFDVQLEPYTPEKEEVCLVCFMGGAERYYTVYTRECAG